MKRIKSKKDIPWFDINNYDYIKDIDDIALLEEVIMRTCIYEQAAKERVSESYDSFMWSEVLKGQPNMEQSWQDEGAIKKAPEHLEKKERKLKKIVHLKQLTWNVNCNKSCVLLSSSMCNI